MPYSDLIVERGHILARMRRGTANDVDVATLAALRATAAAADFPHRCAGGRAAGGIDGVKINCRKSLVPGIAKEGCRPRPPRGEMTAIRPTAALTAGVGNVPSLRSRCSVVGFTRLASADEDRTLAQLRSLRVELIDPTVASLNGRVFKRTGDGALVEFRSVVEAVRCAVAIQNAMLERNAGALADQRIEFRVGIHLGDVVEESDGDLMGDGVNIAARLEGVCAPGAVCLSEDAYRQVKARLDLAVTDLGPTRLKNLPEPMRVYAVAVGAPAPAKPAPAPASEASAPPRLSMVVLPFANLGGGPEQDDFVDGVTESLTTDLSRIRGAFVIGRNTAFTYRGRAVDLKQIGRELNVRYVLEGSVQRGANRIRVNVQLIDAETSSHLWAERFDKPLADLFVMQDEIVARLAGALNAQLVAAEARRAEQTPSPELAGFLFPGHGNREQGAGQWKHDASAGFL